MGALLTLATSEARAAAPYKSCRLSVAEQRPPGGTPAYAPALSRSATSCTIAKRVMLDFHRCRTAASVRCPRKVARTWRCAGRRDAGKPTFHGSFTCSWGARRVIGSYLQDTPACFGAAARDPLLRCVNNARQIRPRFGEEDPDMGWICDPGAVPGACLFGFPAADADTDGYFAIIGDSHVGHWRSPLGVIADVERWRGFSISVGGCFFSDVVARFQDGCADWYNSSLAWFTDHPEVDTVFVTANADTPVAVAAGETVLEVKTAAYMRTFQALPKTVKHVIALRDTTITKQEAFDCVAALDKAATTRLATACTVPRAFAVRDDPAVAAAKRLHAPRYASIDLTPFMCGAASCYPVVGGTLVNGDIYGHLRTTFTRTLAPYLLRELRKLMATWERP
jgi:hypothetical protein